MTEERRRAGLLSNLVNVLFEHDSNWQLTSERGVMHLVVYDQMPNQVFTLRDDVDIIRATNALERG